MKKLLVILLFLMLIGCAHQPVKQEVAFGKVWCCCNTSSGMCCNWTNFCPGYIPGCFCK